VSPAYRVARQRPPTPTQSFSRGAGNQTGTHCKSVMGEVGHDEYNMVPVPHTSMDGDHVVPATAEG